MVNDGEFREDLLYRINTIHLELPALRQRKADIVPLANRFLRQYGDIYNKTNLRFSDEAEKKLTDAIKEIVNLAGAETIKVEYRKYAYETLEKEYNKTIKDKLSAAVWKLAKDNFKVTSYPEKLVEECRKALYEQEKYKFWTANYTSSSSSSASSSSSKESNYKHYGGYEEYALQEPSCPSCTPCTVRRSHGDRRRLP